MHITYAKCHANSQVNYQWYSQGTQQILYLNEYTVELHFNRPILTKTIMLKLIIG